MPKERIYGTYDHDVVVHWSAANSAHTKHDDGYAGTVYVGVAGQTADGPDTSSPLDRTGINRLIRALRRARDNAFGADQ